MPDRVPPWMESIIGAQVTLRNEWRSNEKLQQRFINEFIKDTLHAEISSIVTSWMAVRRIPKILCFMI